MLVNRWPVARFLLPVLLALPLAAATVEVNVEPAACPSGVYRVVADDTLHCAEVDRIEVLIAQRNFHERAQTMYQRQNEVLGFKEQADALGRIMREAQDKAEAACRASGRSFDKEKVECGEALPAAGGNEQ